MRGCSCAALGGVPGRTGSTHVPCPSGHLQKQITWMKQHSVGKMQQSRLHGNSADFHRPRSPALGSESKAVPIPFSFCPTEISALILLRTLASIPTFPVKANTVKSRKRSHSDRTRTATCGVPAASSVDGINSGRAPGDCRALVLASWVRLV